MAAKDVNLLDDDADDGAQDDYDDMDDGGSGADALLGGKRSRGGGGSKKIIRVLIIALVVLAVLGGGGWGVYEYWWIPRLQKEQNRLEAQRRLEELKKRRKQMVREEAERRRTEAILLKKLQQGKEKEPAPQTAQTPPPASTQKPAAPAPAPKAATPAPAPKPPVAPRGKVAKEVVLPPAPRRMAAKKPAPRPAAPSPAPRRASRPPVRGAFFAVQVATCRTARCVSVFSNRLRQKGYEPMVSPPGAGRRNEVLIGKFSTRDEAEALGILASRKNIRTRIYRAGNVWNVSAGSFSDLEQAAQRLDRVEESGFRGEIVGGRGGRFHMVRTGRLRSRREALSLRRQIIKAGFSGSFVVRQNGAK